MVMIIIIGLVLWCLKNLVGGTRETVQQHQTNQETNAGAYEKINTGVDGCGYAVGWAIFLSFVFMTIFAALGLGAGG